MYMQLYTCIVSRFWLQYTVCMLLDVCYSFYITRQTHYAFQGVSRTPLSIHQLSEIQHMHVKDQIKVTYIIHIIQVCFSQFGNQWVSEAYCK